jgi:hypothetical protein
MKKVTVSLEEKDNEVADMILDIFKGKVGAQNIVNLVKGKLDKECDIYDKVFEKELRKLKPEWFSDFTGFWDFF